MRTAAFKMKAPVRTAIAIGGEAEQRRVEVQAGKHQPLVGPKRQSALQHRKPPGQAAQEAVVQAAHAGHRSPAKTKGAILAGYSAQLGRQVHDAEPRNGETAYLAIEAEIITTRLEVSDHDELAVQLVGPDRHRVGDELLPLQLQHTIQHEIAHDPFDEITLPVQSPCAQMDRDQQRRIRRLAPLPLRPNIADQGTIEGKLLRLEQIFIAEARERAVEAHPRRHVPPLHRLQQSLWPDKADIDQQIVESGVAQIERSISAHMHGLRSQRQAAVHNAV